MGKTKAINSIIASEDLIEDFNDGFSDYIPRASDNAIFELLFEDTPITCEEASIKTQVQSFDMKPVNKLSEFKLNKSIVDEKSQQQLSNVAKVRGLTPPIDGEPFDIKRGYQFRASTIKKLNQLKGSSDNINIYLNEIIDAAICYYYDSMFKN